MDIELVVNAMEDGPTESTSWCAFSGDGDFRRCRSGSAKGVRVVVGSTIATSSTDGGHELRRPGRRVPDLAQLMQRIGVTPASVPCVLEESSSQPLAPISSQSRKWCAKSASPVRQWRSTSARRAPRGVPSTRRISGRESCRSSPSGARCARRAFGDSAARLLIVGLAPGLCARTVRASLHRRTTQATFSTARR